MIDAAVKSEKFEIARRSMWISVYGAIRSKSRESVMYGFVWAGRKIIFSKYHAGTVTISGSFKLEIELGHIE